MLDYLISFAQQKDHPIGLLILLLSSMIEYLFPPFPGDTITLFGAVLITAYRWSFWWMMLVVTAGSLFGAAGDYYLGAWARRKAHIRAEHGSERASKLEALAEKLKKYGEAYIVLNRFLPGVRAFFFYAAGFGGLRFWRVMFFAALSSIAWNLLIVAAGSAVGANFEELQTIALEYAEFMWIVLCLVALVLLVRYAWRRRAGAIQK